MNGRVTSTSMCKETEREDGKQKMNKDKEGERKKQGIKERGKG